MRILMIGAGPFAAPTFRELLRSRHEVAGLVSTPLRPPAKGTLSPLSAMRDLAHEHQLPIFAPENINDEQSQQKLREYSADLMVVCDYGQILSAASLATTPLGGINLHASLLPRYRGAAPINWAIYHGEKQTGVTVIHMTPTIDAGPCIAQVETDILSEETAVELEKRLAELGAWLVVRTIDQMEEGTVEELPQDSSLASKAPRLKKEHGVLDWKRTAEELKNQIRAFEPWPRTFTHWLRKNSTALRIIPGPARVINETASRPGEVLRAEGNHLWIGAGKDVLSFNHLQPAGKRMMPVDEFLRGYPVPKGDFFGTP